MSSTRQAVVRSPNFTGLGYFPDLTPFCHDERQMGRIGLVLLFLHRTISASLKKPVEGNWDKSVLLSMKHTWLVVDKHGCI
jgi:hypothetical protein